MPRRHLRERTIFATYPEIQGVEFLSGSHVVDKFDAHMHECFTIGVTLEGTEHFWCNGIPHAAGVGDIALLNPYEVHKGGPGPEGYWTYRMIYPQSDVLETVNTDLFRSPPRSPQFSTTVVTDPTLAAALGLLQSAMDRVVSSLERQSLLLSHLGALAARHVRTGSVLRKIGREPRAIGTVRQYLHANYAGDVRLEELSAVCGLSRFHLLRTFRRVVGMPPHAYLRQIRVEQAKLMLAGGAPISEVALATGFADQSHMNRLFKRILGMTPGEYASGVRSAAAMRLNARKPRRTGGYIARPGARQVRELSE
jgi:AraC-like DNA-binding protein